MNMDKYIVLNEYLAPHIAYIERVDIFSGGTEENLLDFFEIKKLNKSFSFGSASEKCFF